LINQKIKTKIFIFLPLHPFLIPMHLLNKLLRHLAFLMPLLFGMACSEEETTPTTPTTPTSDTTVPAVYKKIYGASSITSDGTYITIKTNGVPDHKSPYFASGNSLYIAYSGTTFGGYNFAKNPNSIVEQSTIYKIPINPKAATTKSATPLGRIGVALNGVPFFNQYAGPNNQELTGEIHSVFSSVILIR
jgi:hypothetical protein